MTLENMASGIKLAIFLARVLKNPEEEAIKVIEEFSDTSNSEISELKTSICTKLECDNINIAPGEDCITIEFIGIKKPIDVFAVNIVGFVYKLLDKMKMFISVLIPNVDIEYTLNNLSVTHDEIDNTVIIVFPGKEGVVSLDVKYIPEDNMASIEIPIHSEKVLAKLKEMKEK